MAAAGELSLPLAPERPLQQVALADVGKLVVALLNRKEEFLGQRIEVAGDEPTPQQMVAALSAAGGRPVSCSQIDVEQVAARNADLAAMYRYLEGTGYQVDIPRLRERFPEVAWTSFVDWVRSGAP